MTLNNKNKKKINFSLIKKQFNIAICFLSDKTAFYRF